jgi:hypothetical protein
MEPIQQLIAALCEIWVEEDIESGKLVYESDKPKVEGRIQDEHEKLERAA